MTIKENSGHSSRYRVPSQSNIKDENDITLGVIKGTFADDRPFIAEIWWWEGFVGLTYRFSKIDLEQATEDEIVELLVKSKQLKPTNNTTRQLVCGLKASVDSFGNEIWNISVHLGVADRITTTDPDGITRSFVSSEINDVHGGPPPLLDVLETSTSMLVEALITIQMLNNRPHTERDILFNKLSKEYQEYIQSIINQGP